MSDIDWLAVDMVCQGTSLALKPNEKRMVVRRVKHRMLTLDDWFHSTATAHKLTAGKLAERLRCTARSIERYAAELPPARQDRCPVCRQTMWVIDDTRIVERHGDALHRECPMSGRQLLRGLAAVRPDLYEWMVS